MRGSTGVDLFGVIDPQLNWNTVPKGKHRVPRRPRTSLIDNKKSAKTKPQSEDIADKGSATGEMTVSDSEKLGVTILGHHFDGPIEGVPLKKRFHLVKTSCLSPLPVSDAPSRVFEPPGETSRHLNAHDNTRSTGIDNSAEVADFSGISILAAAACDSTFCGDVLNSQPSVSTKMEPDIKDGSTDKFHEQRSSSDDAVVTAKMSSTKDADAAIVDADGPKENSISHPNNKPKVDTSIRKVKTSRDIRLHWDLNKAMDAWECPLENDESSQETAFLVNEVDMVDENLVKANSCSSVGLQDIGCMLEPAREMVSCNVRGQEAAPCRKEYQIAPDDATVIERNMNCSNKPVISYTSAENVEPLSPKASDELPSCNLDSAAETEGSSSDEVSTRNTRTGNMKSVMSKAPMQASGNDNKGTDDSTPDYSVGKDETEKSSKEERQGAAHIEVSSLSVSVSSGNGCRANDDDSTLKDVYHNMEIAAADNGSLTCQSRENVESQHPSVSNDCISEVSINPMKSHLKNDYDSNVEVHNACEKTDHIPANYNRVGLSASDQHEDFKSDLSSNRIGSVSVSLSSLGSMQRGLDGTVGHDNHVENQYDQEPVGMEKIELEDGELRESLFDWEIDGNEDGEMEHVDYDTDNKDMYMFEDSSDHLPSATLPHEDNPEAKVVRTLSNSILFKETAKFGSSPSLQILNNIMNERKCAVDPATKGTSGRRDCQVISEGGTVGVTVDLSINSNGEEHQPGDHDSCKRSANSISFSKFSGWDQSNDDRDALREVTIDADMEARRGHSSGTNSISPGGIQRAMVKSSVMKDVSLRTDRIHPSKFSHRKVGSDIYDSRSHSRKDFNQTTERDGSRISSFSRNGPSIQMRERNKGGSWTEPQSQSGPFQHEAPGFYNSNAFAKHGFKNAAEAAAARVAENGLVVAPDGTVVEPNHLESTIRAPRRTSSISSIAGRRSVSGRFSTGQRDALLASGRHSELRPLREISPSRHVPVGKARGERYGPKVFTNGQRGARYDSSNPRDEFDAPLSVGQPFYQRERSYSPHRGSFRIYACQTKSRSRSRTRSPPGWATPRKRGDSRRSGSPAFRRWSRSPPNYRSDELRSPSRRSNFLDRAGDFIPSTKWMSDRKDARDSFRQHEYRRPSGRSPPARPPSHIHGRPEAEEYRQPMHHGRFREFPGVGKRARFDRDENRGRDGRFDRFASPPRQNDGSDRVKRLQYDADGFGGLDSSCFQNDTEISSVGRSRGFNRGVDNEIQRSPRRSSADRSHFRYETDGGGAVKHAHYRGDETVNGPPPGKRN